MPGFLRLTATNDTGSVKRGKKRSQHTNTMLNIRNKKELDKKLRDVHLYCFTPGSFLRGRDPLAVSAAQIKGGADVIQLREKDMAKKDILDLGLKLRQITRQKGVLFIVNDDIEIALKTDADGVHLGQDDTPISIARPVMKEKLIGISTHSVEQAIEAINSGADYIGVGPVFKSTTKDEYEPVGIDLLLKIRDISPIPYVAIGGISLNNIEQLTKAHCHSAAVISDIMNAADITKRCRELKHALVKKQKHC